MHHLCHESHGSIFVPISLFTIKKKVFSFMHMCLCLHEFYTHGGQAEVLDSLELE